MSLLNSKFSDQRIKMDSLIIQGLDPKDSDQRKQARLLSGINRDVIGFKPNAAFYQDEEGQELLRAMSDIREEGMLSIIDYKAPDGANTNAAAFKAFAPYHDAVTIAPAAGDIEETIAKAKEAGLDTISMGVMSFPGVLLEIYSGYDLFMERAERAVAAGTDGFVMGATAYVPENEFPAVIEAYRNPKSDRPISWQELSDTHLEESLSLRNQLFEDIVRMTRVHDITYLVPGFGRQGGNFDHFLSSGINLERCMINAGSEILKAEDPQAALKEMNGRINQYR